MKWLRSSDAKSWVRCVRDVVGVGLGLGWGWEAEWVDAEIFFWSKMHSHNYINEPVDLVITRTGTNRYHGIISRDKLVPVQVPRYPVW